MVIIVQNKTAIRCRTGPHLLQATLSLGHRPNFDVICHDASQISYILIFLRFTDKKSVRVSGEEKDRY